MSVAAAQDWDSVFALDRYCMVELQFCKSNPRSVDPKTVSDLALPFIFINSDVSNVACAGHIAGKDVHAHRIFTEAERQESSTYRELVGVQFVLSSFSSFSSFLPNSRVKWFTDSQGAARIVQVGSMDFNLHKLASDIFSFCFKFRIYLDIEWVPRSLDEKADYLSKIVNYDVWELAPGVFRQLDDHWRPFTVDCFAPTTTRSQNLFLDSGIPGRPELTRFSKTGDTKIAWLCHRSYSCRKSLFSCFDTMARGH